MPIVDTAIQCHMACADWSVATDSQERILSVPEHERTAWAVTEGFCGSALLTPVGQCVQQMVLQQVQAAEHAHEQELMLDHGSVQHLCTLGPSVPEKSACRLQEVLPALLTAVSQHVRPVAPHLFTAAERATMQRMTELLLEHGATLALTGSDAVPVEGAPDITLLSPPVHRLILFGVSCPDL